MRSPNVATAVALLPRPDVTCLLSRFGPTSAPSGRPLQKISSQVNHLFVPRYFAVRAKGHFACYLSRCTWCRQGFTPSCIMGPDYVKVNSRYVVSTTSLLKLSTTLYGCACLSKQTTLLPSRRFIIPMEVGTAERKRR